MKLRWAVHLIKIIFFSQKLFTGTRRHDGNYAENSYVKDILIGRFQFPAESG